MSDTIESLRGEIDTLKTELAEFKAYAKPVIDGHQPAPKEIQQMLDAIPKGLPPRPLPK